MNHYVLKKQSALFEHFPSPQYYRMKWKGLPATEEAPLPEAVEYIPACLLRSECQTMK
jgi:hypothetical protein